MPSKKGNNIFNQRDYLRLLASSKRSKDRINAIINLGSKKEIDAISEVITNVLHNNINISRGNVAKLAKLKVFLRNLASRQTSLKRKKAILRDGKVIRGGFLGS